MTFAVWKNITETKMAACTTPDLVQSIARRRVVYVIHDIPEGTSQASVVERLHAHRLPLGDEMSFEDEFPAEIHRQLETCPNLVPWTNLK